MNAPKTIRIVSAGGGHGASTMAIAIARFASAHGPVALVSHEPEVLAWLLGRVTSPGHNEHYEFRNGRSQVMDDDPLCVTVVDSGRIDASVGCGPRQCDNTKGSSTPQNLLAAARVSDRDLVIAALRGPSVLGVRTLAMTPTTLHGVVILRVAGSTIALTDVENVVGSPVLATIPAHPAVSRAIDSGMLERQLPELPQYAELREWVAATVSVVPSKA